MVGEDHTEQRGFASTVAPHQRPSLAAAHMPVEILQDHLFAILDLQVFDGNHRFTRCARFRDGTGSVNDGQRLTVAEAGILQGFPADYPWRGGRKAEAQQVANAIPPPMAAALIDFVTSKED